MNDLVHQYLTLIGGYKLLSILVLIIVDTILGIILAIKNKEFAWSHLADFLNSSVLMMFGGYFLLGIVAMAEPSFQLVVPASMALIDAKLIADIVNKFKVFGLDTEQSPATKIPNK